ncbi:hypothetical protein [Streptomyces anulatus]|uniref:hypothetical protein n=1 Tax=Streptomyces anulatus TaxID=1892 RepID=UPI0036DDF313
MPLATVQAQNAALDRVIPAHVVHEFHSLMPTTAQLHDEGWGTGHLASALTTRPSDVVGHPSRRRLPQFSSLRRSSQSSRGVVRAHATGTGGSAFRRGSLPRIGMRKVRED